MRLIHAFTLFIGMAILSSCQSNPEIQLHGKWVNKALKKTDDGRLYIEFLPKGNAVIKTQGRPGSVSIFPNALNVSYEIIDHNHIKFTGPMGISGINKFEIAGNKLILISSEGNIDVFTKEE